MLSTATSNHRLSATEKLRELQGSVATIVVPGSWQRCSCRAEMPFRAQSM